MATGKKDLVDTSTPDVSALIDNTDVGSLVDTSTPDVSALIDNTDVGSLVDTSTPDVSALIDTGKSPSPSYSFPTNTKQIQFTDGSRQVIDKGVTPLEQMEQFYQKIPTKNYRKFITDSIAQEDKKEKDLTAQLNNHLQRKGILNTVKEDWNKLKLVAKRHSVKSKKDKYQVIDKVFNETGFYDFLKNLDKLPLNNDERLKKYQDMRKKIKDSLWKNMKSLPLSVGLSSDKHIAGNYLTSILPEFSMNGKYDFEGDLEKRYIRELYKDKRDNDIQNIINTGGIQKAYYDQHPAGNVLNLDQMNFDMQTIADKNKNKQIANGKIKNPGNNAQYSKLLQQKLLAKSNPDKSDALMNFYKRKLNMGKFSSFFSNFFDGVRDNAIGQASHPERIYDEYLKYTGKVDKMASEQYNGLAYALGSIFSMIGITIGLEKMPKFLSSFKIIETPIETFGERPFKIVKTQTPERGFDGIKLANQDTKEIIKNVKNFQKLKGIKKGTQEYKVLKEIVNNVKLAENIGTTAEGYSEIRKLKSLLAEDGTIYDVLNSNTKVKRGIDSLINNREIIQKNQGALGKLFSAFFDTTKYKLWSKAPDSVIKNMPQIIRRLISNGVGWTVMQKLKTDKSSWDYRLNKTRETFGKQTVDNMLMEIPLTLRGNLNFVVGSALISTLTHLKELKHGETKNFVSDYFRWWIWNYLLMATHGVNKVSSPLIEKKFKKQVLGFVKENLPQKATDTPEKLEQSAYELLNSLYGLRDFNIKNFNEFHFPPLYGIDNMLGVTLGKTIKERTKMFLSDPKIAKEGNAYAYELAVKDIKKDLRMLFHYNIEEDAGRNFFDEMNTIQAKKEQSMIKQITNEDIPINVIKDILVIARKNRQPVTFKINGKNIEVIKAIDGNKKNIFYYWSPKKAEELDTLYPYKREVWQTGRPGTKERVRRYYKSKKDFVNKNYSDFVIVGMVGKNNERSDINLKKLVSDRLKLQKEITNKYNKYFTEDLVKGVLEKNKIDTTNTDINKLLTMLLEKEERLKEYINQDNLDFAPVNKISFEDSRTKDFLYFNLKGTADKDSVRYLVKKFFIPLKVEPKFYKTADNNIIVSFPKGLKKISDTFFYKLRNYVEPRTKEVSDPKAMGNLVDWIMPVSNLHGFLTGTNEDMKVLTKKIQLFKEKIKSGDIGKTLEDKITKGNYKKYIAYRDILSLDKVIREGYLTQDEADGIIKILASSYVPQDIASLHKGFFKNIKQVNRLNDLLHILSHRGIHLEEGNLISKQVEAESQAFKSAVKFIKYLKEGGNDYENIDIDTIVDIAKGTESYKDLSQNILDFTKSSMVGNELAYKLAEGVSKKWEGWLPHLIKQIFKNKFIRQRLGEKKFKAILRLSDRFRNWIAKDYYDSANPFFAGIGKSREFEGKKAHFFINALMHGLMPELYNKETKNLYDNVLLFDKTKAEIKKWFTDSSATSQEAMQRYRTMLRLKTTIKLMNELLLDFSRKVLPEGGHSELVIPRFHNMDLYHTAFELYHLLNEYRQNPQIKFLEKGKTEVDKKLSRLIAELTADKTVKPHPVLALEDQDFLSLFKENVSVPKVGEEEGVNIRYAVNDIFINQREIKELESKLDDLDKDTSEMPEYENLSSVDKRAEIDNLEQEVTGLRNNLSGYDENLVKNVDIMRENIDAINNFILHPKEYMRHMVKSGEETQKVLSDRGGEKISPTPNKLVDAQYLTMDEILQKGLDVESRLTKSIPLTWQYYIDKLSNYYLFNNFKNTEFLIDSFARQKLENNYQNELDKKNALERILYPNKSVEKTFDTFDRIKNNRKIKQIIEAEYGENSNLAEMITSTDRKQRRKAFRIIKKAYRDAVLLADLEQKRLDEYIPLEKDFKGKEFFDVPEDKKFYIHKDLFNLLKQINQSPTPYNPMLKALKKLSNKIKVRQFYIPTRIAWNDSFQSIVGGINPLESLNEATKLMLEGANSKLYTTIHHGNMFNLSSAFDSSIDKKFLVDFLKELKKKNIKEDFPELLKMKNQLYIKHPEAFKDTIGKKAQMDKFLDILFLNGPMEHMQDLAWKLDEVMRISYVLTYMKHNPTKTVQEAVDKANLYLINYDRVPKKAKNILNYMFFTPVFKTQTWRLWKEMVTKGLVGGDPEMLKAFGRTVMMRLITDFTMNYIFNLQKQGPRASMITLDNRVLNPLGYRYEKFDKNGNPTKVYSITSPIVEPDKLLSQNYKYILNALSPALQMIIGIITGRKRFGGYYRTRTDSTFTKLAKTALYTASYNFPMVTSVLDNFFNADNGLSQTDKMLNFLGLVFVYNTKTDIDTQTKHLKRLNAKQNKTQSDRDMIAKLNRGISFTKSKIATALYIYRMPEGQAKKDLIAEEMHGRTPTKKEIRTTIDKYKKR